MKEDAYSKIMENCILYTRLINSQPSNEEKRRTNKEIIIKSLISNKAPKDVFEQIILVGTDEYPD